MSLQNILREKTYFSQDAIDWFCQHMAISDLAARYFDTGKLMQDFVECGQGVFDNFYNDCKHEKLSNTYIVARNILDGEEKWPFQM